MIIHYLLQFFREGQFCCAEDPPVAGEDLVVQEEELGSFYPDYVQEEYAEEKQREVDGEEV